MSHRMSHKTSHRRRSSERNFFSFKGLRGIDGIWFDPYRRSHNFLKSLDSYGIHMYASAADAKKQLLHTKVNYFSGAKTGDTEEMY